MPSDELSKPAHNSAKKRRTMPRPIFIVGTMRSGSTLLRLVLDSHPNIAISEETGFMGAASATRVIPNWRYGAEWYTRLGWTEEELDARLREFYAGMFERYATGQGKRRWGEKTPFHAWHIEAMARIFPDAVFLAIVRHPAAVIASLKKRFHYSVTEATSYWESTNTEIVRHGTRLGAGRFALCRYEDLVLEPETTLREVVAWLEEPWSDDVLHHNDVQTAKGAPRVVDGSTSTREPINTERVTCGTGLLTSSEQSVVQAGTSALARFLGYDSDDPRHRHEFAATTGDRSAPRRLLTGDMLEARRRHEASQLSFAPRTQDAAAPEMGPAELAQRLRQVEATLARVRSRPVVRFSDAVRKAQRRVALPRADVIGAALRRRLRRHNGQRI